MKGIFLLLSLILMASTASFAQKMTTQEINEQAKEDAKMYKKEGWRVDIGEMPIEFQIRKSLTMMNETTEDGEPMYMMGSQKALGKSTIGAYATARQFAMDEIVKKVRVVVEDFTKNNISTEQKEGMSFEDINGIISKGTSKAVLVIGNFIDVVKCYRLLDDKKTIEAHVIIACSMADVEKAVVMTMDMMQNEK